MTYKETTEYLFNRMPMFERQGAAGYKEGLGNTLALDEHFGHPHRNYKTIHIAGTNGKGSCAHTLAAILQLCGYKVGLYTSPHIIDFKERIRINGQTISEEYIIDFVEKERKFFEPLYPSFFEVTTAMAFKYFSDMQVDVAVIEVGLGGRLDCTNIISPILSIITNISLDHTQFLGTTAAEIAKEKAGIIKKNIPVVIGETTDETYKVFRDRTEKLQTPVVFAEEVQEIENILPTDDGMMLYTTKTFGEFKGELTGYYQEKNTATILESVKLLIGEGYISNSNTDINNVIKEAFANVSAITGLMGRWQKISSQPLTICDAGHNTGGWKYIGEQLRNINCQKKHIVFGIVNDKDIDGILTLMPDDAILYITKPDSKRALNESEIIRHAKKYGLTGTCYPTVREAYCEAKKNAEKWDLIFIGGSFYVISDFMKTCV